MYEAFNCIREGSRTYSFKVRKGYYHHLDKAIAAAKSKAEHGAVPYVMLKGRCVWSPLFDRPTTGA
jgi:hypothetical protein